MRPLVSWGFPALGSLTNMIRGRQQRIRVVLTWCSGVSRTKSHSPPFLNIAPFLQTGWATIWVLCRKPSAMASDVLLYGLVIFGIESAILCGGKKQRKLVFWSEQIRPRNLSERVPILDRRSVLSHQVPGCHAYIPPICPRAFECGRVVCPCNSFNRPFASGGRCVQAAAPPSFQEWVI